MILVVGGGGGGSDFVVHLKNMKDSSFTFDIDLLVWPLSHIYEIQFTFKTCQIWVSDSLSVDLSVSPIQREAMLPDQGVLIPKP